MAQTNEQMAEIVRAGGNLPPGYVYDGTRDEVRKMDSKQLNDLEAARDAEESAAKARAKIREAAALPVVDVTPPANG